MKQEQGNSSDPAFHQSPALISVRPGDEGLITVSNPDGKSYVVPYGYEPCWGGGHAHRWIFSSGGTADEVPEGAPCECGKQLAHWETDSVTGEKVFRPQQAAL